MFIVSLIFSCGFTAVFFASVRQGRFPSFLPWLMAGAGVVAGCVLSPPLLIVGLLVVPILAISRWRRWSQRALLASLLVAMVASYGVVVIPSIQYMVELERLKDKYPFESMEARLPERKRQVGTKLSDETKENLVRLQEIVSTGGGGRKLRLMRLHQNAVRSFTESPGFGPQRMIRPSDRDLGSEYLGEEKPLLQPEPAPPSTLTEDDLRVSMDVKVNPLREMHLNSVVDFSFPGGFGLIENRKKVAGFLPHLFHEVPKVEQWKLQTIELVGLLMDDDPVVYISDELPNMKKLRAVPTRSLNTFEASGLPRLQGGDDLFIRKTSDGIRMLGAVRSVEECMKCHGGERGDLLGAFSYSLRRMPR